MKQIYNSVAKIQYIITEKRGERTEKGIYF